MDACGIVLRARDYEGGLCMKMWVVARRCCLVLIGRGTRMFWNAVLAVVHDAF